MFNFETACPVGAGALIVFFGEDTETAAAPGVAKRVPVVYDDPFTDEGPLSPADHEVPALVQGLVEAAKRPDVLDRILRLRVTGKDRLAVRNILEALENSTSGSGRVACWSSRG